MPLTYRKLAVLAGPESTYGLDPGLTGGAHAILARNVSITPIEMVTESRDLYRPYLGNSEDVIGAFFGRMQYEVEAAGSGALGIAPAYGPLLQGCGFAQVINPGVSVVYTPVSSNLVSLAKYFYLDGVLHKFAGARGNVGFRATNRSATMWAFNFAGLFVPVSDSPLPAADYGAFQRPLALNKANTPTFTIHGVAGAVLRSMSFDMGNQVVYRNLVNSELVRITDRKPVGTIEMGAEVMAVKNWFNTVRDAQTGALQLVHGTTPGNVIEINAPRWQFTSLNYSDFEGDAMLTGNSKLMPGASGNDEVSITVR